MSDTCSLFPPFGDPGLPACYPLITISSSVIHFSSCPQSFPASGSFPIFPVLCITWPEYCSFSFSISPSNKYSGLIFFRIDWFELLTVQGTLKSLLQTVQKHQFFDVQPSLWSNCHIQGGTWGSSPSMTPSWQRKGDTVVLCEDKRNHQ